jgi:hypothetical protein
VALAASMASLCLIVPLLIFAARIIKSSPVLDALFFQRLPILPILFLSAMGVAGYGRLKGLGESGFTTSSKRRANNWRPGARKNARRRSTRPSQCCPALRSFSSSC